MEEIIDLKPLELKEDQLHETLDSGNMIVLRSQSDFIYIVRKDNSFFLFSHRPGSAEGGRKKYEDDEKGRAILKNLVSIAEFMYEASFDDSMDIRGVMVSAEEGILSMFPLDDSMGGMEIEFEIPGEKREEGLEEDNFIDENIDGDDQQYSEENEQVLLIVSSFRLHILYSGRFLQGKACEILAVRPNTIRKRICKAQQKIYLAGL